jgi:hypothetical protein
MYPLPTAVRASLQRKSVKAAAPGHCAREATQSPAPIPLRRPPSIDPGARQGEEIPVSAVNCARAPMSRRSGRVCSSLSARWRSSLFLWPHEAGEFFYRRTQLLRSPRTGAPSRTQTMTSRPQSAPLSRAANACRSRTGLRSARTLPRADAERSPIRNRPNPYPSEGLRRLNLGHASARDFRVPAVNSRPQLPAIQTGAHFAERSKAL